MLGPHPPHWLTTSTTQVSPDSLLFRIPPSSTSPRNGVSASFPICSKQIRSKCIRNWLKHRFLYIMRLRSYIIWQWTNFWPIYDTVAPNDSVGITIFAYDPKIVWHNSVVFRLRFASFIYLVCRTKPFTNVFTSILCFNNNNKKKNIKKNFMQKKGTIITKKSV